MTRLEMLRWMYEHCQNRDNAKHNTIVKMIIGEDFYKELDKIIEEKTKVLNENTHYKEYIYKLKKFNNVLLASSSLLDDYIEEKVSI